ncbi:MAG TPA: biopolymer transporter ExbD [Xanthomonadaceae bacterium]|jgi:biopolymer transport protein ExbD
MKVQGKKLYDDINITPMLDLAYVLLVIFIIMCTASVQGVKVDLPKASAAKPLSQPKTKVIAVDSNGQVTLDAVPVSMAELEQQLGNAHASNPDLPVILKGDRAVQYEKVMAVLDLCSKLGVSSIGLVSQKPSG